MLTAFDNRDQNHNDAAYIKHLAQHPTYFVLNAGRKPKASYLVLHRATCSFISRIFGRGNAGGLTERQFLKIVSDNESELKDWLQQQNLPRQFSHVCSMCFNVH